MCEKVPSILPGEKICDSCRKQQAAESEQQSLPQGHSGSFPESDVVPPTDEMFGHPLATLTVANEHLDAVGETPLICSDKSCRANGMKGKSLNHYSNDVGDDSEIIAQLKEKYIHSR